MPITTLGNLMDIEMIGSWFSVEIKDGPSGYFSEASGLSVDVEVVEFTDAAIDTVTRKRPGATKYSEITLKRALSKDKSFWDWVKQIRDGELGYRKDGSIVVFDMSGVELGRWNMLHIWPSKWSASDLDVGSDDLMMEDVTLQVEQLERAK